jgi:hypothetical protein
MNWDYVAGFFDGEGCAIIREHKRNFVTAELEFSNTNRPVLDEIQSFIGVGKIWTRTPPRMRPARSYDHK